MTDLERRAEQIAVVFERQGWQWGDNKVPDVAAVQEVLDNLLALVQDLGEGDSAETGRIMVRNEGHGRFEVLVNFGEL